MTLESGQVLAARHALLRKLGDGGTSEVWLARDREAGSNRILKVLRPELASNPVERGRFLYAARLQLDLDHPNVLRCIDVQDGDPVHAVFRHEADGDLSRWRGRSWQQLVPMLRQVAEALTALHARGIVHRDLKPANVLIASDGRPLLADFGVAAAIGDTTAVAGGSPFTASPQQLDGAPPAIADDVYAFGALAYELLIGYPPFYPDVHAARSAAAPPHPPGDRLAIPGELDRLVQRCLARDADQRPHDVGEILKVLRAVEGAPPAEPALRPASPARVELRAPDAPPSIEPQWARATRSGPSASELRSQGFRRGLVAAALVFLLVVAGLVFFALPRWVERGAALPASPPKSEAAALQPAQRTREERDLERLAAAKRQYEELQPVAARRLAGLDEHAAGTWGGDEFARAKLRYADADAAFGKREYDIALAKLREADTDLQATQKKQAGALASALEAGRDAIEAGDAAGATSQYALAIKIDPSSPLAARGLKRAASLDEVRGLLAEATGLEGEGKTEAAAAAYRKALQLDPDAASASAGLARLQSEAAANAFATAVADGLAAISRKDYPAARAAFQRADRIRPGAPEVHDGLAQVERALGDRSLASHLEAARRAEREERWRDALDEYRKALQVDANLLAAQQGVERAEPRAMLDAELAAYLARPERLFSSEVRGAARSVLQQASSIPGPGPLLTRQVGEVSALLAAAETPVRVAIASDNQTEVTIYRIGKLGTFERKDMELMPGKYTVVGTRAGFRDVRRELTILPGQPAPSVEVRCEEQI